MKFLPPYLGKPRNIYCNSHSAPKWYFNKSPDLPEGIKILKKDNGLSLTIKSVQLTHSGLITCVGTLTNNTKFIAEQNFTHISK